MPPSSDSRPGEGRPEGLGLYVLLRNLEPNAVWMSGAYEVRWTNASDRSCLDFDAERHEVIEVSRDASAAEWSRLVGFKDDLMKVLGVMEA